MGGRGSGFENWGLWVLNVQQTEARSSGLRVSSVEFVFHMHNCRRRHIWDGGGRSPRNLIPTPNILRSSVSGCVSKYKVSKNRCHQGIFCSETEVFLVKKAPYIYILSI